MNKKKIDVIIQLFLPYLLNVMIFFQQFWGFVIEVQHSYTKAD